MNLRGNFKKMLFFVSIFLGISLFLLGSVFAQERTKKDDGELVRQAENANKVRALNDDNARLIKSRNEKQAEIDSIRNSVYDDNRDESKFTEKETRDIKTLQENIDKLNRQISDNQREISSLQRRESSQSPATSPQPSQPQANQATQPQQEVNSELKENKGKVKRLNTFDKNCKFSTTIDARDYACRGTEMIVNGFQVGDQIGQAAGFAAVQTAGQLGQGRAMTEGTQEASLKAAAQTSKIAAAKDLTLGLTNTVGSFIQFQKYRKHNQHANSLSTVTTQAEEEGYLTGDAGQKGDGHTETQGGYVSAGSPLGKKIVDGFKLNEQWTITGDCTQYSQNPTRYASCMQSRKDNFDTKKSNLRSDVSEISDQAAGEQGAMADQAKAGAITSAVKAAPQLLTAGFAFKTAREYEKAAKELERLRKQAPVVPGFDNVPQDPPPSRNPNNDIFKKDVENTEDQDDLAKNNTPPNPDLPPGFNPLGGDIPGPPPGPNPGVHIPGLPDKPSGGGAGGIGGLGGTSPATDKRGEEGARLASLEDTGKNYLGDGQRPIQGGKGAGAENSNLDLSSLLGQFLPKAEEDFQTADRMIAFEGVKGPLDGSLLGKDVNIFERIHGKYQDKNKEGHIGF